jgi:hypothetical protein
LIAGASAVNQDGAPSCYSSYAWPEIKLADLVIRDLAVVLVPVLRTFPEELPIFPMEGPTAAVLAVVSVLLVDRLARDADGLRDVLPGRAFFAGNLDRARLDLVETAPHLDHRLERLEGKGRVVLDPPHERPAERQILSNRHKRRITAVKISFHRCLPAPEDTSLDEGKFEQIRS